jgi:RsiW-degrading membrane proteinase PrsW (M82 family)
MRALAVLVVSAAPAVAFLVLILRMDRREPEPLAAVLRVIGFGAAGAIVAGLVEGGMESVALFQAGGLAGAAAVSFIQVAPIEEACKLGVVLLVWRKPAFNEENDGIVYAGASAMGFALLENILYVARGGIGTGVMRAFTSIPLHIFTGVIAGLFIGKARFAASDSRRGLLAATGFLLAWAVHGLYDFFAMSGSALALLVLPLVAGLSTFGVIALKAGRRASLLRWGPRPAAASAPTDPAPVAVLTAEPPVPAPAEPAPVEAPAPLPAPRPARCPRPARWMAVLGRMLLGLSLAFWALLFVGLATGVTAAERGDVVLGGVLITLIPLALGVVLEWSYQARRKRAPRESGPA